MKSFLLLALTASLAASAEEIDCKKAITTIDVNRCEYADWQVVEKKLNETYRRVLGVVPTSAAPDDKSTNPRQSLIVAQRAWVAFREADCSAVFDYWSEGTIRTIMRIGCMRDHAELRIKQLERYEERH